MEQLVVILIFGVIAAVNQILKKNRERNDASSFGDSEIKVDSPRIRPVPRPVESEEERMRRFMEALGRPATQPVPRKITPPIRKSVRAVVQKPQKEAAKSEPLPKEPEKSVEPNPVTLSAIGVNLNPVILKNESPSAAKNIFALIRKRESLQQAVLMREILDLPRGIRGYE